MTSTTNTNVQPKLNTFNSYEDEVENSDSDTEEKDMIFQDMQLFMHAIGEPQLVEHFLKQKITLGQLLEFNEQDLINCGVELVGDRKKILENTGQMHCEKWMPASLQDMTSKSLMSSPGYYIALNDINKHIEYIGVTFKYLRRRLEEQPELLELGKDYVGVAKVASELEDLLKTTKTTYAQLRGLNREVGKHLKDPVKRPANHMDEASLRRTKMRQKFVPITIISMSILACVKLTAVFLSRK